MKKVVRSTGRLGESVASVLLYFIYTSCPITITVTSKCFKNIKRLKFLYQYCTHRHIQQDLWVLLQNNCCGTQGKTSTSAPAVRYEGRSEWTDRVKVVSGVCDRILIRCHIFTMRCFLLHTWWRVFVQLMRPKLCLKLAFSLLNSSLRIRIWIWSGWCSAWLQFLALHSRVLNMRWIWQL